ncbi:MAG: DegQ family serine endoprotease [Nitrosomonadaceae bacterium]|nr:DegQ family serine endoprotease [Nitrosomonadaceae bacterium]
MMDRLVLVVLIVFSSSGFAQIKELPDFTELVGKQGAAVVNISTIQVQNKSGNRTLPGMPNIPEDSPFFEFFRRYMPPNDIPGELLPDNTPKEFESKSLGSGFIISADGHILTNAHVVDSADEITIKLTDKREFYAKVVGVDRKTDIALLKIEANNLPQVSPGDPNKLRVGEWVVAIGSPFGFENSVTAGIVSAKGRSLAQENYVPFIQTDVAINPGNSGGPLFNMKGEVVGINSQIYSRTGGFMGLSFAIPIDVAMDISNQLRVNGKVSRGKIGVVIQEVTKELAESFGLIRATGALVTLIQKGGPAEKAGLQVKDIILKFDGKIIYTSSDLPRIVGAVKPGSRVNAQVWRDGHSKEIVIAVEEIISEENAVNRNSKKSKTTVYNRIGLALRELTPDQKKQLEVSSGFLVEDMQSGVASRAGMRLGDLILGINNQDAPNVDQFNQILKKIEKGRNIALLIRRGEMTTFITMKLTDSDNK